MLLGASLPLQVDGHEIRAGCHQEPDDFAAAARIPHKCGQRSKDAFRDARVRPPRLAVPQCRVGFVDHHSDGTKGIEQAENPLEIGFGLSLPHRAEIEQLDDGNPDLGGKAPDHEALAGTHRSADQEPHRNDVEPALPQRGGGLPQQGLRPVVSRHGIEAGGAGQE